MLVARRRSRGKVDPGFPGNFLEAVKQLIRRPKSVQRVLGQSPRNDRSKWVFGHSHFLEAMSVSQSLCRRHVPRCPREDELEQDNAERVNIRCKALPAPKPLFGWHILRSPRNNDALARVPINTLASLASIDRAVPGMAEATRTKLATQAKLQQAR